MDVSTNGRKGKAKVKSGCRTCKIRKVKCDEGRPACQRCLSTGRQCDGYGIWGGGSKPLSVSDRLSFLQTRTAVESSHVLVPVLTGRLNLPERQCFEWFQTRTVWKLPGSYRSDFWKTLVLQAGSSDSAVLQACLALSTIQRRGAVPLHGPDRVVPGVDDPADRIAVRHYVKAIGQMAPHLSTQDKASQRAALIACAVFVCFETLRGHFQTAQTHFRNAFRIMEQIGLVRRDRDGVLRWSPSSVDADYTIVEAFSRLHLQMEMFAYLGRGLCSPLQIFDHETPYKRFENITIAWKDLQRIMNHIFFLSNFPKKADDDTGKAAPVTQQKQVLEDLSRWHHMFESLDRRRPIQAMARILLECYHNTALIMAETCLAYGDEMIYDSQVDRFAQAIRQQITMFNSAEMTAHLSGYEYINMVSSSRAIIDMGCIAPLFFIAVKCRDHRIRCQAIKFLEFVRHSEGIWCARDVSVIARKVMEIEEGDFYKDAAVRDDFPVVGFPDVYEPTLPELPQSYRLSSVDVMLQGTPLERIILYCHQERDVIGKRCWVTEYDLLSEQWFDYDGGWIDMCESMMIDTCT